MWPGSWRNGNWSNEGAKTAAVVLAAFPSLSSVLWIQSATKRARLASSERPWRVAEPRRQQFEWVGRAERLGRVIDAA